MKDNLDKLVEVCHWMNQNHFSPGTSGNYSLRKDSDSLFVSISGIDKGKISPEDFIVMSTDGKYDDKRKPSDESLIHAAILKKHPNANCVLHAHTVAITVVSMNTHSDEIIFNGYEMQKTFSGHKDHNQEIRVKIIPNTQDIKNLSLNLPNVDIPCLVLKGHGVYVWGENIDQARRHLEGIEFLMQCQLETMRLR